MSTLYLFIITQKVNCGYDTYDCAVVAAESSKDAVLIHPGGLDFKVPVSTNTSEYDSWAPASDVECEYLGEAKEGIERGVICASFKRRLTNEQLVP
jgi:hypothetical protein